MKGDEMLSFMPGPGDRLAHSFRKRELCPKSQAPNVRCPHLKIRGFDGDPLRAESYSLNALARRLGASRKAHSSIRPSSYRGRLAASQSGFLTVRINTWSGQISYEAAMTTGLIDRSTNAQVPASPPRKPSAAKA